MNRERYRSRSCLAAQREKEIPGYKNYSGFDRKVKSKVHPFMCSQWFIDSVDTEVGQLIAPVPGLGVAGLVSSLTFPHHHHLDELSRTAWASSPSAPTQGAGPDLLLLGPQIQAILTHITRASSTVLAWQGAGSSLLIATGNIRGGWAASVLLFPRPTAGSPATPATGSRGLISCVPP